MIWTDQDWFVVIHGDLWWMQVICGDWMCLGVFRHSEIIRGDSEVFGVIGYCTEVFRGNGNNRDDRCWLGVDLRYPITSNHTGITLEHLYTTSNHTRSHLITVTTPHHPQTLPNTSPQPPIAPECLYATPKHHPITLTQPPITSTQPPITTMQPPITCMSKYIPTC